MNIQITLSDEQYQTLEAIARARGQTPEQVIRAVVDEYLAEPDPDADMAAGRFMRFRTSEDFLRALGADEAMLARARKRDQEWAKQEAALSEHTDANV